MTAILAMKPFQDTFHSGTTGIKVSIIFSLYTVWAVSAGPACPADPSQRLHGRRPVCCCHLGQLWSQEGWAELYAFEMLG